MAVISGIFGIAWKGNEALVNAEEANRARAVAEAQRDAARRQRYAAHMILAQRESRDGQTSRLRYLLDSELPRSGEPDLRGFEWYYLRRLCRSELLEFDGHTAEVSSVAYSPDGKHIASAALDGTVKIWAGDTGLEVVKLAGHSLAAFAVAYRPDGLQVASVEPIKPGVDTIKLWDVASGREVKKVKTPEAATGYAVAYSPDGSRIAYGAKDGTVKIWDTATRVETRTFKGHTDLVSAVAYSPDGKRIASASWDNTVRIWDIATGQEVRTFTEHHGPVYAVAYSPDGERIASAGSDGIVKVCDIAIAGNVRTLKGHTDQVYGVAFSPDGSRIASASWDKSVKIWDSSTGSVLMTIRGHSDHVQALSYRPDGRRIASAGHDKRVRIWDATVDRMPLSLHDDLRTRESSRTSVSDRAWWQTNRISLR